MRYNLRKIKEEIDALDLTSHRAYNLTSAVYELKEEKRSSYKKLVPLMLNCCLG